MPDHSNDKAPATMIRVFAQAVVAFAQQLCAFAQTIIVLAPRMTPPVVRLPLSFERCDVFRGFPF